MNEEFILTEQTVNTTAEMVSTKVNDLVKELQKVIDASHKVWLRAGLAKDVEAMEDVVMFCEKAKACITVLQSAVRIFYNI